MSNNKAKETREDIDVNADKKQASDVYKKLPDDPDASQDDYSVSTADNSAGGKYSKTGTSKADKPAEQLILKLQLLKKAELKFCLF